MAIAGIGAAPAGAHQTSRTPARTIFVAPTKSNGWLKWWGVAGGTTAVLGGVSALIAAQASRNVHIGIGVGTALLVAAEGAALAFGARLPHTTSPSLPPLSAVPALPTGPETQGSGDGPATNAAAAHHRYNEASGVNGTRTVDETFRLGSRYGNLAGYASEREALADVDPYLHSYTTNGLPEPTAVVRVGHRYELYAFGVEPDQRAPAEGRSFPPARELTQLDPRITAVVYMDSLHRVVGADRRLGPAERLNYPAPDAITRDVQRLAGTEVGYTNAFRPGVGGAAGHGSRISIQLQADHMHHYGTLPLRYDRYNTAADAMRHARGADALVPLDGKFVLMHIGPNARRSIADTARAIAAQGSAIGTLNGHTDGIHATAKASVVLEARVGAGQGVMQPVRGWWVFAKGHEADVTFGFYPDVQRIAPDGTVHAASR